MTTEERSLVRSGAGALSADLSQMSGMFSLAAMSEEEFGTRLKALKLAVARADAIKRELMTADEDYGQIPGLGKKPTLLKPGAEKLCNFFGLHETFANTIGGGDGESAPEIDVVSICYLHRGDSEAPIVGQGGANCNSWERKYRYRQGERACPVCGLVGSVFAGKGDRPGWYCWAKKGGCGANFRHDDERITKQTLGQVENPDPHDLKNTIIKMAQKRAYIDATLRTTATSGLFTQDLEDLAHPPKPEVSVVQAEPPKQATAVETPEASQPKSNGGRVNKWEAFIEYCMSQLGYKTREGIWSACGADSLEHYIAQGGTIENAVKMAQQNKPAGAS
ncbi:MAG: hypothetical protein ABIH46_04795 [Chloroflexota bacterium]